MVVWGPSTTNRVVVPAHRGYLGWRNRFLGIDSWAPCSTYLGAGASGADVMLIMSGSLIGIMPKVMFLLLVSYVHLTCTEDRNFEINGDKSIVSHIFH
jgi:hypothetical protein